jgi:Sulfotransferase family
MQLPVGRRRVSRAGVQRRLASTVRRARQAPHHRAHAVGSTASTVELLQPILIRPMEGRTGSTLLMSLLGTSPEVVFDRVHPYENRYLTYLSRLVEHLADPVGASDRWNNGVLIEGDRHLIGSIPFTTEIVQRARLQRSATRHLWAAFSESVPRPRGVERYYAEKNLGPGLDLLTAAGIQCRVINLVRDPRDVVASIRAFDAKRGTYGFGRSPGQSELDYLGWLVRVMARNLADMTAREGAMWIRYEDLVSDLPTVTAELSQWLGIDLQPAQALRRARDYGRHVTVQDPLDSVGRWRSDLSAQDLECIDQGLRRQMLDLGYTS